MDLAILQYLWVLRPLMVFLSAVPFILVALLMGRYLDRRRERHARRVERADVVELPHRAVTDDVSNQADHVPIRKDLFARQSDSRTRVGERSHP